MTDSSTQERLLEAAGPVFAEKGYDQATVREICLRAGVNLAAVNYHFGDKERLYLETIKQARVKRMQQFPLPVWDPGTSAEAKLHDFVMTLLRRMLVGETAPWQTQLMMREILQPSGACSELVEEYFRPQFEILMGIVAELGAGGCEDSLCRKICFSVIGQCLFYRVSGNIVSMLAPPDEEPYELPALADHITRFTLSALGCAEAVTSQTGQPAAGVSTTG